MRKTVKKEYAILKSEMFLQGIPIEAIAESLNRTIETARLKIDGKVGITIEESKKIAGCFPKNNSLDHLFKSS